MAEQYDRRLTDLEADKRMKRISWEFVTIMLTLFVMVGGGIWWAGTTDARVQHLENQANKGSRFTASDGMRLGLAFDVELRAQRKVLVDHIERTEPMIIEIHDYVVEDRARNLYEPGR